LLAKLGNRERAADLYEMAGELERAAREWAVVAAEAPAPDPYLDRIEELSKKVAAEFLRELTKGRAPDQENADLHYRLARACADIGEHDRAREVFGRLTKGVGIYKDVAQRLAALPVGGAPIAATAPSAQAPVAAAAPTAAAAAPPPPPIRAAAAAPVAAAPVAAAPMAPRAPVSADDDTMFNPAQALAPQAAPAQSSKLVAAKRAALPRRQTASDGGYRVVAQRSPRRSPSAVPPEEMPIDDGEVRALVQQVSRRAADQIRVVEVVEQMAPSIVVINRQTRRGGWWGGEVPLVVQTGVESRPVKLDALLDEAVLATQQGPSIVSLLKFIKGQPCDLGNIEVYYRLGLSYLAKGMWSQALEAFKKVEEASPGYRDAEKRADTINSWHGAMGERRTTMGDAGTKGRYVLEGELGRGGMAVVYRAHDRVLGRDVALKFMAESVSQQKPLRDMFQREARAAASLNHPNIVTIYDFGMMEDRAFISMELVDGVPLDQLEGELSIVESVEIARQALQALSCAHERDIIHRDIKPANMMRTRTGLVKLMDFGLAKPLDPNAKESIIAGTPAFMPPEQLSGGDMDARVDVFAMGVTLYEMLTGELPYIGMDRDALPRRPKEHVPEVPEAVDEAIMCAIEPDPAHRFASALTFASSLGRVMDAVRRFSSAPPSMD
jgi:tetratricopeptide (TPR) repeat protein